MRANNKGQPVNFAHVRNLVVLWFSLSLPACSAQREKSHDDAKLVPVASPTVVVTINFPNPNASLSVDSVMVDVEQAINGVTGMRYMGFSHSPVEASMIINFEPGTDPNAAALNVQNRIQPVKSRLPPLLARDGVIVTQATTTDLMYVNIYSTDKGHNLNFLYNYAFLTLLPEITRVRGVTSATILGSCLDTLWFRLDLDRMREVELSENEVINGMQPSGMIGNPFRRGQRTRRTSQSIEYVSPWFGHYSKPEQYKNLVLKASPDGRIVRFRDIGDVEVRPLYPSYHNVFSDSGDHPSATIVVKQLAETNTAVVMDEIKKRLKKMKEASFPPGMAFQVNCEFPASWRLPRNRSQPAAAIDPSKP